MITTKHWPIFLTGMACLLTVAGAAAESARANPRAGIDFYLQSYGRVAPSEIPDVYVVFEKVRSVADKSSLVNAQLIVVGDTKQASAFTLSDGTIFLSKRALAVIGESVTHEEAQARLAFVLGHELAHLASNDFWDNQISQALLDTSMAKELTTKGLGDMVDTSAGQQKKELKADDQGFLYAALAGYNVDSLLRPSRTNEDFLSFWNAKAGKRNDPRYPLPEQRTSLLRLRLSELSNAVQYFDFGVRLMHFGRYREAIGFFREFQKQFPSRELFNNLGYCHLRLAVSQLDPDYAYRYWLPMLSDLDTSLTKLTMRSAQYSSDRKQWRMSASTRESLMQAARYFELAIERDGEYAPSYVNLAVAQLLLGMDPNDARLQSLAGNNLLRAQLAVGSALKLRSDDLQVKVLAAIIDYEAHPDANPNKLLTAFPPSSGPSASREARSAAVLYNLAQIASEDPVKSAQYWQELIAQFESMPTKLQAAVCRQQNSIQNPTPNLKSRCDRVHVAAKVKQPWPLPVDLSRDLVESPFTAAELKQNAWQRNTLSAGAVFVGERSSVLATDEIVTMVVLRRIPGVTESLQQCCAQPLEKIPVVNGSLWHYGRWIARIREGGVEEIWVAN
jgi:tetratricopeptide (TPR) repeat protein